MLFATNLAPEEQVAVLRAFLGDRAEKIPAQQAESLCRSLEGLDEKVAARRMREDLFASGIDLKHTQALHLVGKLAGRAGWHRAPVLGKGLYRFMAAGTDTQESADEFSNDPARLLGNMCEMAVRYAKKLGRPAAPTLRRSAKGILLDWMQAGPHGLIQFLQAEGESIPEGWQDFLDGACERLRRVLEEGDLSCFCDGYFVATAKPFREYGKLEITVHHETLELGRGNELLMLDRIEREVGGQLGGAVADMNRIEVGRKAFYIGREHNAFEPLYSHEVQTFLHPETEELVRRYRRFAARLRMPIGASPLADKTKESGHGIPQTVPVSWEAINARQNELKMQDGSVEEAMGRAAGELSSARKDHLVDLTFFVQLAKTLDVADFNSFVAKPSWKTATSADEEHALRSILHAVDEVRFVLTRGFSPDVDAALRESCSDLAASRKTRDWNRHGVIKGPLDDALFSVDADEFLTAVHEQGATVRATVRPIFIHAPELEVPAVGRKAVIILSPAPASEARGAA